MEKIYIHNSMFGVNVTVYIGGNLTDFYNKINEVAERIQKELFSYYADRINIDLYEYGTNGKIELEFVHYVYNGDDDCNDITITDEVTTPEGLENFINKIKEEREAAKKEREQKIKDTLDEEERKQEEVDRKKYEELKKKFGDK